MVMLEVLGWAFTWATDAKASPQSAGAAVHWMGCARQAPASSATAANPRLGLTSPSWRSGPRS